MSILLHDTHIQGFPCTVELEYHQGSCGCREGGQSLEPDESAGYTFEGVYASGGRTLAFWLWDKMTDEDRDRILSEVAE